MEFDSIAVLGAVLLVGASILGSKIRIATPLILVVIGIGIGYLPFVPLIEIEPEIILVVVLPPLLYGAAVNVPIVDFRRNFRPIVALSVMLVIMSAVVVGFIIHWLAPVIPLPAAMALGAVISPTDAVAATSIGKRLGMPERVVSILEGESLVNDATSLVLLKTAVAAVSGSFALSTAAGSFALSVTVALVIGYLMGVIAVWLRSKLTNPVHDTIISFIVPFIAFVPAEEFHGSGVLAVVVAGLYIGHHATGSFSPQARQNERLNWRSILFVLENGVFLVMGLQLHSLVEQVIDDDFELAHIGLIGLGLVALLILMRSGFMVPLVAGMRGVARQYERRSEGYQQLNERVQGIDFSNADQARVAKRLRRLDLRTQRSSADLQHELAQQLGWRDGVVLAWSGMRGVVTLAAAQSISTSVPYRPQIVLIAFVVAVITLLLHGLTLPLLIRKLWPEGAGSGQEKAELAALGRDLVEAADDAIDEAVQKLAKEAARAASSKDHPEDPADAEKREKVIEEAADRAHDASIRALAPIAAAAAPTVATSVPGVVTPADAYQRLLKVAIDAQREALLEERAIGRYRSQALRAASIALDAYETRLGPQTH